MLEDYEQASDSRLSQDEITEMYKTASISGRSHSNSLTSLLAASDEDEDEDEEEEGDEYALNLGSERQ